MLHPVKNQHGYSLVELLVALTLLAIGLLAVASMQGVALGKGAISYKLSAASYLAREAMDDIMSWDISNPALNSSVSNQTYKNPSGGNTFTVEGGGSFTITYTTQTATPGAGTTRVDVKVSDTRSAIRDVTITCFKKVTS